MTEDQLMGVALLYRITSVLLILFAIGHTIGFRRLDPKWGVDSIIAELRTRRFEVQGASRTYWDFYVGFGLFVSVLLLFLATLSWQLGGLSREVLSSMPVATWGLALCLVAVTFLSWRYFFMTPVVFSAIISLCLLIGAWLAGRP